MAERCTEKVFIVTGGNAGIGYHACLALAKVHTNRVVVASRSLERVQKAVDAIIKESGNGKVEGTLLDLSSLSSVKEFVATFLSKHNRLDGLVCNAGLQNSGFRLSKDGFEETFAVNHLGHYLLVRLLLPLVEQTGSPTSPAHIVVVASGTHDPAMKATLPAPDFQTTEQLLFRNGDGKDKFANFLAYTNSKLCNVLFSYELLRNLKRTSADKQVAVFCYDPGFIPTTGLKRDYILLARLVLDWVLRPMLHVLRPSMMSTEPKSGQFLARLAMESSFDASSGKYWSITSMQDSSKDSYNEAKAKELWQASEALVQSYL